MEMVNRSTSAGSFRYGFNGKEKDNEDYGEGNGYDYGSRVYNSRLGKFLSVDPLTAFYPYYTPYQFAGNSPIANVDLDGAEPKPAISGTQEGQVQTASETSYATLHNIPKTTSETWYWHGGGLGTGMYKKDANGKQVEVFTQAGWYTSEGYLNVLASSSAAKQLAADAGYSHWVRPGAGAKESLAKFVGEGLSDNTANYLNAAAWRVGSNANFMASGYIEPSSFNVEDMIGLGLLAKEGIKLLVELGTNKIVEKVGGQHLLRAPEFIQRHHVLPQQFKSWFGKQGIKDIDAYTIEISSQTHLKGVHGSGLGNLPGNWNQQWNEFIKTNPNASPSEIFNQAERMLKQYGLEHLPYVPYKK
jgi:RHS repeat-associated protein